MYTLNLFLIAIIALSLFYNKLKFIYLISLLCSLGLATFIYAQENLLNIILSIVVFNLTPLACLGLKRDFQRYKISLEKKKAQAKANYEQMLKERSIIKQSNAQLDNQVFQIAELYRMTKDMSLALELEKILDILGKKLKENLRFARCRMILVDEELPGMKIKDVWELRYEQVHPRQVNVEINDSEIIKRAVQAPRVSFLEREAAGVVPLLADSKLLGALAIEGLAAHLAGNFYILANQFALEFKRISLYSKMQKLAITDGLTGLFVRRYFLERLEEEMKRSLRHNLKLCFLMADIDHFKQCNDNSGHLTGDLVLKEVARIVKDNVREIDLVGRYGGEEFSVLLPDTDKVAGLNVAERIRASIARYSFRAYEETVRIKISLGVANFPEDAGTPQMLIDKSDQALYRAKQEGRNKVCVFAK
ncbi:MAG: GGDEF domain-containing protein [Candidatus Omnitrophica bacterium]|nr:GGDEF domain-containing protein [Candidatus Omnitrophota bacterium]